MLIKDKQTTAQCRINMKERRDNSDFCSKMPAAQSLAKRRQRSFMNTFLLCRQNLA
jgi:hypothetical protein